jgi:hypothetical protein
MIDSIKAVTPVGVAGPYPYLNKPSTKFNPEGVYSVKLILSKENSEKLIENIEKLYKERVEEEKSNAKGKTTKIKESDRPYEEMEDGQYMFRFKQSGKGKRKDGTMWDIEIPLFDKKGDPIDREVLIYGGSQIQVNYEARSYYTPLNGVGVSLRIRAVRVVDLKTGSGKDAASFGFDIEDSDDESGEDRPESNNTDSDSDSAKKFY